MFINLDVENVVLKKRKSPINCGDFPNVDSNNQWNAIAALNILIFAGKLEDDIRDDNSLLAKTIYKIYSRIINKAKADFPQMSKAIEKGYAKIVEDEKQAANSIVIAQDFGEMMLTSISSVFQLTEQQTNITKLISGWIYVIDALDDYDKDIKEKHYNPFHVTDISFSTYVQEHLKEIDTVLLAILGSYSFYDEENFKYYSFGVIMYEFIPEVTYKILSEKKLRTKLFRFNRDIVFSNRLLPFDGAIINIDIPTRVNDVVNLLKKIINTVESFNHNRIRINFISSITKKKAKRIIKSIVLEMDSFLSSEIKSKLDITLELENSYTIINQDLPSFEEFSKWAFDQTAIYSEYYIDLTRQFVFGHSNLCEYNSCFGRFFYIDLNGLIYACKRKLILISNIDEIADDETLITILNQSVNYRNFCSSACTMFALCGGGCPISTLNRPFNNKCITDLTFQFFSKAQALFYESYEKGAIAIFNKYIQNVFLEHLAYKNREEKYFYV
jgi:radical SAM protein with 4Fe4S-binding SPASM domain